MLEERGYTSVPSMSIRPQHSNLPGMQNLQIRVVPGQAGRGSFKIQMLIAHRAEQRMCLQGASKPSVLRSNNLLTFHSGAISFQSWIFSHFARSHRIAASLGNCSLHPIVTVVCVIPSHLISSHLIRVMSSQRFSPPLISSPVASCHLMSSSLLSFSRLFSATQLPKAVRT